MKISASCNWLENRFGYEKAFRMMKEAGFDAVDFGIDDWVGTEEELKSSPCYRMSSEELTAYYTKVYETAKEIGLEIAQTHAVFGPKVTLNFPELFKEVTHHYPDLLVHLRLYNAAIVSGTPEKLEHNDIRFITVEEIDDYAFCPADTEILERLKAL